MTEPTDDTTVRISRRKVLRTTAASAVTIGGVTGFTGSASAGTKKCGSNDPDEPGWYPWYDIENWTDHGVPWNADEIAFYVNGWQANFDRATNQGYENLLALEQNDYWGEPVGALWDSVTSTWSGGKDKADDMGYNLAYLVDHMQDNYGNTIRLVGHSLGARVIGTALRYLRDWNKSVPAAVLLGGAVENDSVVEDCGWGCTGEFYYGIRDAADQFDNYHSYDDSTLEDLFSAAEWDKAVGETGADGTPPSNYTDHDVTNKVGEEHCRYYKRDVGCMDEVVRNW